MSTNQGLKVSHETDHPFAGFPVEAGFSHLKNFGDHADYSEALQKLSELNHHNPHKPTGTLNEFRTRQQEITADIVHDAARHEMEHTLRHNLTNNNHDIFHKMHHDYELAIGKNLQQVRSYAAKTRNTSEAKLLSLEAKIGGKVFHDRHDRPNSEREFYALGPGHWIYYETWGTLNNTAQEMIRFEVRPEQIIKNTQGNYFRLEGEELENVCNAMKTYYETVLPQVYGFDAHTGQAIQ
jgi:hypothetical protein